MSGLPARDNRVDRLTHTPGPWMWDDDGNLYPEGPRLAYKEAAEAATDDPDSVYPDWVEPIAQTDNGCYGPRGADRYLIAAAPDLLLALKRIAPFAEVAFDRIAWPAPETLRGGTDLRQACFEALRVAEYVIAKAEGQES